MFLIKKKQPEPHKHPVKFLMSSTPLFFGFYMAVKIVLSVLLFALVYSYAVEQLEYAHAVTYLSIFLFSVAILLIDIYAWTILPAVMYYKKNKAHGLFIALNVALLLLIAFVIMFTSLRQDEVNRADYRPPYCEDEAVCID